ncbi:phage head spike fiber domain-containing protein [Aeromonas veronii]|uniref:phage head spike fiber domain-containing protein n=1 Tax=Aeromonas veronii TaxID=654 RepID=UPI003D23013B
MAGLWPRTGNVTVTNGSKTITGFGTKWKTGTLPIQKGHTFYGPDNFAYEVDTVVSDESLTLVEAYRGSTLANQAYRIDITRTSTISQFAADLASLVAKYRAWFDGMMTWLTGSGDVAILNPDTGANITIPSWKKVASEGEGQAARAKVEAARAKVEADRAKTEADRALSEADRAAGIVAAAALPLPDVWAPLSDSLRMITGYGRDVLVGSDVVARMVNFSRNSTATYIGKDGQLKTAAANEPRFEKEGLLLEGQSQNIVKNSNLFIPFGSGSSKVDAQPGPFGLNDATRFDVTTRYGGTNPELASSLTDGAVYTTSVWLKGVVGGEVVRLGVHNGSVGVPVTLTTEWKRYQVTQTRVAGANAAFIIQADSATMSFVVYGSQLEVLPFASSYIPTAGAAVTRAQDLAWLPAYGNEPFGLVMSIATEVDLLGKGLSSWPRPYELSDSENKGGHIVMAYGSWDGADLVGKKTTVALRFSDRSHWAAGAKRPSQWNGYLNQIYTGNIYLFGTTNPARAFYGHVRNIRAWFVQLSDDQHKAIK